MELPLTETSFQPGWTALKSAKLLFEAGDFNGATDRAYYAMHGIAALLLDNAEKFVTEISAYICRPNGNS